MILKSNLLIISYIPFVYKSGGFCITINTKSEIKSEEIQLKPEEISELLINSPLRYKNRTPNYKILLNEYFDELIQKELI